MCSNSTTVLLKKRERTQNWLPEEKNALFSLIKEHVNAIENKKIDAAASAMKTFAWQQIYSAFRGRFSTDRDITRIREQWRRMKGQARMEMYTFAEKVNRLSNFVHFIDLFRFQLTVTSYRYFYSVVNRLQICTNTIRRQFYNFTFLLHQILTFLLYLEFCIFIKLSK